MGAVNVRVLRLVLAVCGGLALLAVGAARGAAPSPDPSPVVGPAPDPFPTPVQVHVPVHVPVRPAPAARPVVVVERAAVTIPQVTPRPRRAPGAPVEQPLRFPDHAPPVALGAADVTGTARRIPLAVVIALGTLTLASGVLVVTIARAERG